MLRAEAYFLASSTHPCSEVGRARPSISVDDIWAMGQTFNIGSGGRARPNYSASETKLLCTRGADAPASTFPAARALLPARGFCRRGQGERVHDERMPAGRRESWVPSCVVCASARVPQEISLQSCELASRKYRFWPRGGSAYFASVRIRYACFGTRISVEQVTKFRY